MNEQILFYSGVVKNRRRSARLEVHGFYMCKGMGKHDIWVNIYFNSKQTSYIYRLLYDTSNTKYIPNNVCQLESFARLD